MVSEVPVVVTGVGMTTPLGGDVTSSWAALLAGESGATPLAEEWAARLPVRFAAQLRKQPTDVLGRTEARRLDRSQQVAVVAAREAWADAGAPGVDPVRLAVAFGTGIGGALTMLDQDDLLEQRGPRRLSPFTVPMLMPNAAAGAVSIDLGARGGAHAPASACASGAEALAVGLALIRSGRADAVVAGGTDACLHPLSISGFAQMGALSTKNDTPEAASRPFDVDRDGFVMAEGSGALVLERADFAAARGARAYATFAGAGVTSDGRDMTRPDVDGQLRAVRAALETAGLSARDVDHVNAHATGTPQGDAVEARGIELGVGTHPLVTATKSMTGHLLGAAGAVEAIFTVLTLHEGVVPATRNLDRPDAELRFEVVRDQPRQVPVAAALSNSFGFGGHNVVLAFTR
ncbi:beta-ketoacyl-[acyl-carrier-protein] synthase family protein [Saccharothrix xinjiangensis]|uniref:Beta-ketoacyl-[acyl-carrier-protein] synthase family protein n=1 Tax=Saccharothrix xinjiangensis TaxID=204798 RepID=A0ABV9Y368_9PSEU